jgi:hypothetical protein
VALALAGFVAVGMTGDIPALPKVSDTLAQREASGKVTVADALQAITRQQSAPAAQPPRAFTPRADGYYNQLRAKLRWVDVRLGDNKLRTPDPVSRLLLAQSAAQRAGLHEVGLSYRDVYGIINAETSWVPRMGASKDGTPNLGIAQFEPATARAVGLQNPHDPVEAVHAAALHMKEAAVWSARRLEKLKLPPQVHAVKLREGVSIYYNLSSKGRSAWNGVNTAKLPIETRRHISNAAYGAREAATIEARLRQMRELGRETAANTTVAGLARNGG